MTIIAKLLLFTLLFLLNQTFGLFFWKSDKPASNPVDLHKLKE